MTLAPKDQMAVEEWTQEGAFVGADGRVVRCYDDVVLSRSIPVEVVSGDFVGDAPAGTVGTVLFYSKGPVGVAQLELDIESNPMIIAHEELSRLSLHMTNEEKYPR